MRAQRVPRTLAALTLVLASATTFAADAPGSQACRADAKKVCTGVQPGGGRVLICLKQHEAELSPDCKAALPTLEQCAKELQSACGDSGRRGLRACVRKNADKISPECRRTSL
jgi:hypothetical protein